MYKAYHIRCIDDLDEDFGCYWSEVMGWTPDISLATIFTTAEKREATIPMQGGWSPIYISVEHSKWER